MPNRKNRKKALVEPKLEEPDYEVIPKKMSKKDFIKPKEEVVDSGFGFETPHIHRHGKDKLRGLQKFKKANIKLEPETEATTELNQQNIVDTPIKQEPLDSYEMEEQQQYVHKVRKNTSRELDTVQKSEQRRIQQAEKLVRMLEKSCTVSDAPTKYSKLNNRGKKRKYNAPKKQNRKNVSPKNEDIDDDETSSNNAVHVVKNTELFQGDALTLYFDNIELAVRHANENREAPIFTIYVHDDGIHEVFETMIVTRPIHITSSNTTKNCLDTTMLLTKNINCGFFVFKQGSEGSKVSNIQLIREVNPEAPALSKQPFPLIHTFEDLSLENLYLETSYQNNGQIVVRNKAKVEIKYVTVNGGEYGIKFHDESSGSLYNCKILYQQSVSVAVLNDSTVNMFKMEVASKTIGISIRGNSFCKLRRSKITGLAAGVMVEGKSKAIVKNCFIEAYKYGVSVHDESSGYFNSNAIRGYSLISVCVDTKSTIPTIFSECLIAASKNFIVIRKEATSKFRANIIEICSTFIQEDLPQDVLNSRFRSNSFLVEKEQYQTYAKMFHQFNEFFTYEFVTKTVVHDRELEEQQSEFLGDQTLFKKERIFD